MVSYSEADGSLFDGSELPGLIEYWLLDEDQSDELEKYPHAILKESWLTESHRNEAKIFEAVKGSFGVPRVLCSQPPPTRDSTPRAKPWPLWVKKSTPDGPEQRSLTRTIYLTEGHDIVELETPRKLLQTILHAMLGLSFHISDRIVPDGYPLCRPLGLIQGWMAAL